MTLRDGRNVGWVRRSRNPPFATAAYSEQKMVGYA
jgi:hypothetical protein